MSVPPKQSARTTQVPNGAVAPQFFPAQALSAQLRAAELLADMNGTLLQTARDIWTSQSEWFRQEMTQATHTPRQQPGADGSTVMATALANWQEHNGRLTTHLRQVADRMHECQRQILSLQQKAMAEAMQSPDKKMDHAA